MMMMIVIIVMIIMIVIIIIKIKIIIITIIMIVIMLAPRGQRRQHGTHQVGALQRCTPLERQLTILRIRFLLLFQILYVHICTYNMFLPVKVYPPPWSHGICGNLKVTIFSLWFSKFIVIVKRIACSGFIIDNK